MATSELKARALFDFVAEGPSELSLTAGEIVMITSRTDGNDWWYAQNSSGQFGAVPATYVEIISNESNSTQQSPALSDADTIKDNSSKVRTSSETSYQPRMEEDRQQFMTSTPVDELNQSEHELTTDSSFDSLSLPTGNDNLLDAIPIISNSSDPYKTDKNPLVPNPLPTKNTVSDQHNLLSPFDQPQEQQNSLLGDLMLSSPTSKTDYLYDTPSSILINVNSSETTSIQSMSTNNISSSSANDHMTHNLSINTTKSNNENILATPTTKNKSEKTKLFSLKRQKDKTDPDKRRMSVDNGLDTPTTPSKDESDSDGLTDSGSNHNSLSHSNKHSSGSGDSRTLTRAKFFDKHGVGHYLLHECKTKPDEHVEIAYDVNKGGVYWSPNPNIPPFSCTIENPSKETKLGGLKSFVEYKIHPQLPGSRVVGRRYKQFDWLHEQLVNKYRFICISPLPGKQIAGRFEQEFIEERRRQLELWLNRICHHPVLCASFPVQHFITCELTEKNNKDWKAGKRKVEKDELREASWLNCVTFPDSSLSDIEIATQIDAFAQQQPGLETHLKNLNHGFTKYLERHTEIYEHDMQRVGDLFTKLHVVVQVDLTTPGNDELSSVMSKISSSYNAIAELYKTKGYEGIRDFVERIQDYIGLLACFAIIINIQRIATEFIRNAQQRGAPTTPDLNGAIHRNQALNYVVLAEINFFQKEKVNDLKLYMKSLLDQQIEFYEKITAELRDARSTFN